MNDNILLIVLKSTKEYVTDRIFEHLGTGYLASALSKHGFKVRILDQNITQLPLPKIISETLSFKPKIIGISCYQDSYSALCEYTRAIKEHVPDTHISLGGVFATNTYDYILKELHELDSLILGEGETTFVELVQSVLSGQDWSKHPHITYHGDQLQRKKHPRFEENLDCLAEPARDTLPLVLQKGTSPLLLASRGCYGRCSYCSITTHNRRRRCRDIIQVISEMERLYHDYQVRHIQIIDDTFIGGSKNDHQRVLDFASKLQKLNLDLEFTIECRANEVKPDLIRFLKDAGLRSVFLGIESGYQPTLDLFLKDVTVKDNERAIEILQQLGVKYKIGFIMFHPYTTLEEIKANLDFLLRTDQKNLLYSLKNMLQVFPNTPIAAILKNDEKLTGPWHGYTYPFLNEDIIQVYNFIISFSLKILPELERLSISFNKVSDQKLLGKMAELNGKICSIFVETIYHFCEKPDYQLLRDQTRTLLELKKEVTELV